jgi:hypothetical protein
MHTGDGERADPERRVSLPEEKGELARTVEGGGGGVARFIEVVERGEIELWGGGEKINQQAGQEWSKGRGERPAEERAGRVLRAGGGGEK